MRKKYGFVYLWRDKKKSMFYVGSHWGYPNDGYVCSSPWMKNSYTKRPGDFKWRILLIVETCVADLRVEEQRWLSRISPSELGKKYYNYKKVAKGFDPDNPLPRNDAKRAQTLKERFLDPQFKERMKGFWHSPDAAEKRRISLTGKKASLETREKLRQAKFGKLRGPHSDLHKKRISEAQKGVPRPYAKRPLSEEQKMQISAKAKERWSDPEFKSAMAVRMVGVSRKRKVPGVNSEIFMESRKRGADNGNSKLTEEIVREIRASTGSQRGLAKKYSVSSTLISNIQKRKTWAHVIDNIDNREAA